MIIINVEDFESGLDTFMEDGSIKCSHSRLNVTLMGDNGWKAINQNARKSVGHFESHNTGLR